ncbi:MAG: CpsB/CapC family capsule biosynthesis tyrosine phosphatase [Eubacteriales bacterium]|nr:CpsB/CapC family capsule biosynthesis tyrosine phosphatase [Eubacteriales bacterium]
MIDLHCHILPQVDDGSESLEESMKMIDIAYNDGIRQIVATPHRNHPLDFKYKGSTEEAFGLLSSEVKRQYPDMQLYPGAELFITKDFIDVLNRKPYDFTINNSRYVLIEFDVSASFSSMQEAIHELIVRGFIPILAHVEYYEALFENLQRIQSLKDEGIAIQVTSSNLTGKNGKKIQTFVKSLISKGLVDFVSSDAHKSTFRRPLLKDAFDLTVGCVGEDEAQRIFYKNQQAVIENGFLIKSGLKRTSGIRPVNQRLYKYFAGVAVIMLAVAIFFTASVWMRDRYGGEQGQPTTTGSSEINQETTSTLSEESTETIEPTSVSGTTSANTTDQTQASSEPMTSPSKEAIEEIYMDRLLTYQQEYENQLGRIVSLIKDARETIQDAEERKIVVEGYLNEIINLEDQADILVYQALYELQNELEAYRYDVSIVQEMRDEYHRIKEEKTEFYLNQI